MIELYNTDIIGTSLDLKRVRGRGHDLKDIPMDPPMNEHENITTGRKTRKVLELGHWIPFYLSMQSVKYNHKK